MKVTITLIDAADGKCNVSLHFDPPIRRDDPLTPAVEAATICLEALQESSSAMKMHQFVTQSAPEV